MWKHKVKKGLSLLFAMLIIFLTMENHVLAAEEEPKDTGILQMVVFVLDEEGTEHPVQGGSGFLIGTQSEGAEYIITAKTVTTVSEEVNQRVLELYIGEEEQSQITYKTKAVVKRDVMIDVQLVAESDEMGFAVWKLAQPLYDRQALVLCDDTMTGMSGQKAIALGFPTAPALEGEVTYYAKDETISKEGMIIGDGKENNIKYLYHNISPNEGMIGGTIVNENGDIIGLNIRREAQEGYYGLQVTEILPVLEALGIPYVTTSQIAAELQAQLDAMVHKDELEKVLQQSMNLNRDEYKEDSYAALESCIEEATAVLEQEVTQQEVDEMTEKLQTAIDSLEEKTPLWIIFTVIGVVSFVAIGTGTLVLIKTKDKRASKKQKKIEELTITEAPPEFQKKETQKQDYKKLIEQSSMKLTEVQEPQGMYEDTMGTIVLQQERNEIQKGAVLIRKRTGEKILIRESETVIGKDPSQTDCCITGNSAISRAHAVILHKGNSYDVSDKNATNGTFVNGNKVAAFQKHPLQNGDILRLADEDFEFKIDEE